MEIDPGDKVLDHDRFSARYVMCQSSQT